MKEPGKKYNDEDNMLVNDLRLAIIRKFFIFTVIFLTKVNKKLYFCIKICSFCPKKFRSGSACSLDYAPRGA